MLIKNAMCRYMAVKVSQVHYIFKAQIGHILRVGAVFITERGVTGVTGVR